MHTLVFQAVEETLAGGVVPAISFAAHRREHSIRDELLQKVVAAILAAAIRVMNQPRRRAPTEPRHAQRIDHQLLGHPLAHRPADNLPGVQIENYRQVQPTLGRRDVRDVSRPHLIRALGRKVLLQSVRRHRQRVLRIGGRLEPPLVPATQIVLPHQPLHSPFAHRDAEPLELLVDPRRAIGGLGLLMDLADPLEQLAVAQPFLRPVAALPGRESTVTHLQRRAQHLQRIRLAMSFDKRVPHSDSLAKYAAAFFRISVSILRRTTSARNRDISICSGVIGLPFSVVPSLPSACAFTQLRIDCSGTPISRPTCLTASPARTRRNASSLNSSVYATLGIFFIEHLQRYIIACYRWCPITAGKVSERKPPRVHRFLQWPPTGHRAWPANAGRGILQP